MKRQRLFSNSSSNNTVLAHRFAEKCMNEETIICTPTPVVASTMKEPFIFERLTSKATESIEQMRDESMHDCSGFDSRKSSLGLLPPECLAVDHIMDFKYSTPSFLKEPLQNFVPNNTKYPIQNLLSLIMPGEQIDEVIDQNNSLHEILLDLDEIGLIDNEYDEEEIGKQQRTRASFPLQFQQSQDREIFNDSYFSENLKAEENMRIPSFYLKPTMSTKKNNHKLAQDEITDSTINVDDDPINLKDISFGPIKNTGCAFLDTVKSALSDHCMTQPNTFGESPQHVQVNDSDFDQEDYKTMLVNDSGEKFEMENQFSETMNMRPSYINSKASWKETISPEGMDTVRFSDYGLQRSSAVGTLEGYGYERPTMGMKIQTPPYNRRPVQLLTPSQIIDRIPEDDSSDNDPTSNEDNTLTPSDLITNESFAYPNKDTPDCKHSSFHSSKKIQESQSTMTLQHLQTSHSEQLNSWEQSNKCREEDTYNTGNRTDVLNNGSTLQLVQSFDPESLHSLKNECPEVIKESIVSCTNVLNSTLTNAAVSSCSVLSVESPSIEDRTLSGDSTIVDMSHFIEKVRSVKDSQLSDKIVKMSNARWKDACIYGPESNKVNDKSDQLATSKLAKHVNIPEDDIKGEVSGNCKEDSYIISNNLDKLAEVNRDADMPEMTLEKTKKAGSHSNSNMDQISTELNVLKYYHDVDRNMGSYGNNKKVVDLNANNMNSLTKVELMGYNKSDVKERENNRIFNGMMHCRTEDKDLESNDCVSGVVQINKPEFLKCAKTCACASVNYTNTDQLISMSNCNDISLVNASVMSCKNAKEVVKQRISKNEPIGLNLAASTKLDEHCIKTLSQASTNDLISKAAFSHSHDIVQESQVNAVKNADQIHNDGSNIWQLDGCMFDEAVIGSFFNQNQKWRTTTMKDISKSDSSTLNLQKQESFETTDRKHINEKASSNDINFGIASNLQCKKGLTENCSGIFSTSKTVGAAESVGSIDANREIINYKNKSLAMDKGNVEIENNPIENRLDSLDLEIQQYQLKSSGFRSPRLSIIVPKTKRNDFSISHINDLTLDNDYHPVMFEQIAEGDGDNIEDICSNNLFDQFNNDSMFNFSVNTLQPLQICENIKSSNVALCRVDSRVSNLLPIQFERTIKFRDVCCIGTVSKLTFFVNNPNISSVTVKLSQADSLSKGNKYFSIDKSMFSIASAAGIKLIISYAPLEAGDHEATFYFLVDGISENFFVSITASAENPNLKITTEDGNNYLDFQSIPLGRRKTLKLCIENKGLAIVPLHLYIKNPHNMSDRFMFANEKNETDLQLFSSCHCLIEPYADITFSIMFQTPLLNSYNANKILEFSSKIFVDLDNQNQDVAINSQILTVLVIGKAGMARLHIPNSLECIHLKCEASKRCKETFPLVNKGSIPINVIFELTSHEEIFILNPCEAYLSVGESMNLSITFTPDKNAKESKKIESLLLIMIEPDGPIYEIPVVADILRESICLVNQKFFYANRDYICFFGVDDKCNDEKIVLMNKSNYQMRLLLEIVDDTKDHLFRLVGVCLKPKSILRKMEKLINSRIIMIEPNSDFQLNIRFTPDVKNMKPAFGRLLIKGEGSNINSMVPLYGYCGHSNVALDIKSQADRLEICLNVNNCAQLSVTNYGNRTAFIVAGVLERTDEFECTVEPKRFCLKPNSQRYVSINVSTRTLKMGETQLQLNLHLYTGDEVLREIYKNYLTKCRKSQQCLPGLPSNIDFDSSIEDEEEIQLHYIYSNIPDRMGQNFIAGLKHMTVVVKKSMCVNKDGLSNVLDHYSSREMNLQRCLLPPARESVPVLLQTTQQAYPQSTLPKGSGASQIHPSILLRYPFFPTANKVLLFGDTIVGKSSLNAFTISNDTASDVTWRISGLTPPYWKASNVSEKQVVKAVVFRAKRTNWAESIAANSGVEITVSFNPPNVGLFTQCWAVKINRGEECVYRVQLIGSGTNREGESGTRHSVPTHDK